MSRRTAVTMALTPGRLARGIVLVLGIILPLSPLFAEEQPALYKAKTPQTKQELDRLEAQRLFGQGIFHERNNRLVEAVKAFESAKRLDPDSAAILRALIPLYFAIDRTDDAFTACKRVLKIDPDDYQTAALYARQLRNIESRADAIAVLQQAMKAKNLKERPDHAAGLFFDLGVLQEQASDFTG